MSEKSNKIWNQPYALYLIVTSIIAITSFLIGHRYKISANENSIVEIKACLKEKIPKEQFDIQMEALKKDIQDLKEDTDHIIDLLLEQKD